MSTYDQVLSFIESPKAQNFEPLALEVFRYQLTNVSAYRQYCADLGVRESDVTRFDDIPAVSTLAFKYARLSGDERHAEEKTFLTSGTTIGKAEPGAHVVARPALYRASALAHLRRMMFPDRIKMRVLALHPTADRMPQSSLAQMLTWCIEEFGLEPSECVADQKGVDTEAACSFLGAAGLDQAPIGIFGTTASLSALFFAMKGREIRFRLAPGSRIMDTGGAKGQARALDAEAVCAMAKEFLHIEPALVINEYGMTELCSQLYDGTAFNSSESSVPGARVKIAPPWMRAAAVDAITLKVVAPGEIGMLRFFDLANLDSVSAILTDDIGTANDAGDRVRVMGRADIGEPRGCALAIEEFEAAEFERPT